jgi:putative ABC transport system ATP-binding protein
MMIELERVSKAYRSTEHRDIPALHGIELTIEAGEMVAVTGPSGSGTSTLLNVLSCLDLPTEGRYLLDGLDVGRISKRRLRKMRGRTIGFVFQNFELLAKASVQENVELPLLYRRAGVRRRRARAALDRVGLRGHYDDRPVELFAAQRQKALIARALINDPAVLLDDEPTSDLDPASAIEVMKLFVELNDAGRTIVYCTHDDDVAAWAKRIIRMRAGRVVSDRRNIPHRPDRPPPRLRAV